MKEKMAQYGISAVDLGLNSVFKKSGVKKTGSAAAAKYRGANGEEWSGRGRMPQWLSKAIEQGKKNEDFAI
ncbi:H-NS histone family protein [Bordetella hinzii]|nr:H-NS histone family protein [Bordetella hinzii]WPL83377.1 H-NS histone family protein [Bordetella hinzii]